jgi:predicted methyltransferase
MYQNQPPAKIDHVKNECKRLQAAFPQTPPQLILILTQRIVEKKISGQQITDAVNNLIDNYKYPVPTVAEILSWDKKVKLYKHSEVVELIPKGYDFTMFEKVEINNQVRWILK